jgi:hypothetical protein
MDLVIILRLGRMKYRYTTKLVTTQKPENPVPPPPKYKVMYTVDDSVRSVKISPVHKIVLTGP